MSEVARIRSLAQVQPQLLMTIDLVDYISSYLGINDHAWSLAILSLTQPLKKKFALESGWAGPLAFGTRIFWRNVSLGPSLLVHTSLNVQRARLSSTAAARRDGVSGVNPKP